ncbi:Soluble aldose sugar dehydrogenase YliI precursor [Anatilimnocola aggregata]|uniref:Soluble aldose sugar dehydrogenase YliI n=1 Tax=Anatilimnocola aggregata TaxID=2528021 RepID=A0A517YB15_9BACT|nr:PQQ-dependent sugar dehydrogenase [Anatilimnocola aggregata]QDU27437.1 Soluble aldose sugar dehydrogenase YliI precursor [Anatilimnocola aggregata]
MPLRPFRLLGSNKPRTSRPLRVEQLESRHLLSTLPVGFQEDFVAGGLYEPTSVTVAPDGRIFVTEKPNGVRIIDHGHLLPTPFVSLDVESGGERGVEGLVFDPNFAQNRFVYIYYTHATPTGSFDRLSRFTASSINPNVAEVGSEVVLLDGIRTAEPGFHNGGVMKFAPDGMLFLGIGDVGDLSLPQDLSKLQGKILRLNVAAYPNMIPSDNPFVNTPGARGEIWAYGFRNPFTGDLVPGTDRLIMGDVGSDNWEEINEVEKGKNYGWPLAEGMSDDPRFTNPLHFYPHDNGMGAAVVGGAVYAGTNFPEDYVGKYFFADYVRGFIKTLDLTTREVETFTPDAFIPVDVANAPDGSIYWLSLGLGSAANGSLYRIHYVGGNRVPLAVATANRTNGLSPLTVQFDGTASSDPDGDTLVSYNWDFGDGQTGSGATATHTYSTNGVYTVQLTVSDGEASSQSQPLTITVGNEAPTPTIDFPLANSTYSAGDIISFSGSATDPQDGTLPPSALTWSVEFHHNTHFHPGIVVAGSASGSYPVSLLGEVDADQWYRILLTATDAGGLRSTTYRDVFPVTSTFAVATNPPGGTILLDSQPIGAGETVTGVVNMTRFLAAPPTQLIGGRMYKFVSWSDGGAAEHEIATPAVPTTYTAQYQLMPLGATYTGPIPTEVINNQTIKYSLTITNAGTQTWSATGTNRVRLGVYFDGTSDAAGAWSKDPIRFSLPRNVAPGQSVTIAVTIKVPATAGDFVLRNRLVKEGSTPTWFETLRKTDVAVQTLNATYAGDVPTFWHTKQNQEYQLTVTNTGTATWNHLGADRVRLGVYFGGTSDAPGTGTSQPLRFELPHAVAPGESATITVTLAGPATAGNFTLRHRLEKMTVAWFDDILRTSVSAQIFAVTYSASPPKIWIVGESKTYTIKLTNTGTSTWNATGDKPVLLGVYFGGTNDNAPLTEEPQRFYLPKNVARGQTVTLTITVQAPETGGNLVLRHRLVKEDVNWSTSMLKTSVAVQTLAASYVGTVPTAWTAGETKSFVLTVKNTGTASWNLTGTNPVLLGIYFGGANDDPDLNDEPTRAALSTGKLSPSGAKVGTVIAPGQAVKLTITITAPLTPGQYVLRHRMVKENVSWFDTMLRTDVTVAAP